MDIFHRPIGQAKWRSFKLLHSVPKSRKFYRFPSQTLAAVTKLLGTPSELDRMLTRSGVVIQAVELLEQENIYKVGPTHCTQNESG